MFGTEWREDNEYKGIGDVTKCVADGEDSPRVGEDIRKKCRQAETPQNETAQQSDEAEVG